MSETSHTAIFRAAWPKGRIGVSGTRLKQVVLALAVLAGIGGALEYGYDYSATGRYLVTTDDETSGEYWLTRVDARGATPVCEDIARIPFDARALTFDGERFYRHRTRHAEQYFACPLLRSDRCRDCEWFVEDAAGAPRCAAVTKLVVRHHAHYRYFSLDELRTLLERGRPSAFA